MTLIETDFEIILIEQKDEMMFNLLNQQTNMKQVAFNVVTWCRCILLRLN